VLPHDHDLFAGDHFAHAGCRLYWILQPKGLCGCLYRLLAPETMIINNKTVDAVRTKIPSRFHGGDEYKKTQPIVSFILPSFYQFLGYHSESNPYGCQAHPHPFVKKYPEPIHTPNTTPRFLCMIDRKMTIGELKIG
jgi:hypothetical protein